MSRMTSRAMSLFRRIDGQTRPEYAVVLAVIASGAALLFAALGDRVIDVAQHRGGSPAMTVRRRVGRNRIAPQPHPAPILGGRMHSRRITRDETGQTMAEFAIVLPVLCVLLFGIIQLGIVFNNYVTLTDAVRAGARTAAVSRNDGDPTGATTTAVRSSAADLNQTNLGVTVNSAWTAGTPRDRHRDVPVFDQPARLGRRRGKFDLQDDGASRMNARNPSTKVFAAISNLYRRAYSLRLNRIDPPTTRGIR